VRDVRSRAAVSSASGMTAAEAGLAPPPVGPECEAVTARRGLSGISAGALDGIGGGGVATRTRGGVGEVVVRNGWAPLAMARTSARVRNEPDGSAGSGAPQHHSHTHSPLAAGRSVEVAGREGGSKPWSWPPSKKKRPLRARGRSRNEAQRRGPSGGTKARSWAWWRPSSSVAAKRRHGSKVVGAVVSAPRHSVVAGTVCGGGMVGVTQVDKDGPGPVTTAGRPEVASRQLLSACC